MLRYFLTRLAGAVPTLFIIVTVTFFLIRAAPGGPFDQEQTLPPEIMANLQSAYGLDQPIWVQYGRYLGALAHGDFGPSFRYKDFSVTELIGQGFPVTLELGSIAMVLALALGIPIGTFAALHHNRAADYATMSLAVVGIAIPSFVVLPFLGLLFGIYLHWLPVAGWEPGSLRDLALPVVALALPPLSVIARLTRANMLEILRSQFIRTALAKGLPLRTVIMRHALRPALLPVASYLAPAVASIMTGSLVVESIAGLPGIGRYMVQGALNRDYTLVMGMVIIYSTLLIVMGLVVDLLYAWLDPACEAARVSSLVEDAARRLRSDRGAMCAMFIILALVALTLFGPWLNPNGGETLDWLHVASRPALQNAHWFGTDRLGRDLFARTLEGTRVSLEVGLVASAVSLLVGIGYGAVAGYIGGRTDHVMMRIIEILSGLPLIFFVIFLTVIFGRNEYLLFLSIGAVGWLTMARIVRGQTLSIRRREFIEAAVASGAGTARIIVKHVIPNLIGPVIVYATLTIPQIIMFESFLSFLGLGIQEPSASLGTLIAEGAGEMEAAPWILLVPGGFLAVLLLALNIFGDGLRDALDAGEP